MTNAMLDARQEGDSYRRIEVITGQSRRRRWTAEEKARIVAESFDTDANISEVARRNGVARGLLTAMRGVGLQRSRSRAPARAHAAIMPGYVEPCDPNLLRVPPTGDGRLPRSVRGREHDALEGAPVSDMSGEVQDRDDESRICETWRYRASFERLPGVTRRRRTAWLGM